MSATYNWAYRPGVSNKYGLTVPASADDTRPTGWCYVALFGNDNTGNGSRQYPYKTLSKARNVTSSSVNMVLGSGVYREANIPNISTLIGDGDVIIDISFFTNNNLYQDAFLPGLSFYNLILIGDGTQEINRDTNGIPLICEDCKFNGVIPYTTKPNSVVFTNCVISNISSLLMSPFTAGANIANCTFINIKNLVVSTPNAFFLTSCIVMNCNVTITVALTLPVRYTLFFNCNFRFAADNGGGNIYPATPVGFSYLSSIGLINSALSAAYPTSTLLTNCNYSDPLFNNLAIGDYTLSFNSPAKNLSYFGTYVGAYSIAQSIKVRALENVGGFEFASAVNLTIADDSIILTDSAIDAQVDTKPIVNLLGREIASLPSYGFNADRNGQYIDSIADLDTVIKAAGDTLNVPSPYIVETGSIVYNGATYQPGDRFTTISGQTTFTTAASGTVREILEAPQRHTIMARFSNGGASVSAGTALTLGYYYYVSSGSVTYDSITYNADDVFKAVDTNAFSGSGSVIMALSTEAFQHYEPGIKPTSNNVGDTRTGAIIRGNGDPAYVRGGFGVQEFPINAKFIQIRYMIKANNLKP